MLRFNKITRSLFIAGAFVASFSAQANSFLNPPKPEQIPYEMSFNGGKIMGCEIFFKSSDVRDNIYMNLNNISYYYTTNKSIYFEFNKLRENGGTADISLDGNNNFIEHFVKRRNICLFSPIN